MLTVQLAHSVQYDGQLLYGELGFIQKEPILLLGDNDGSISMAKNPQFHKRTKHVELRWHWVHDLTNDGLINIVDCRDPQQTADILTKQIPRPKFSRHVNELGLSDVSVWGGVLSCKSRVTSGDTVNADHI